MLQIQIPVQADESDAQRIAEKQRKMAYLLNITLAIADLAHADIICGDAKVEMIEHES